ncbi:MAG: hypothetical protein ACI4M5_01755 [Christensenellales bacterium]
MELWRELLISGLQNEDYKLDCIDDKTLKEIVEIRSYQVLLQIKRIIEDERLLDCDCFIKIEEIICALEENKIFCDRHDFG